MNILFVNSTRSWGGVKTWTLDAASHLCARSHGVHIIARPGPFVNKARALGCTALESAFGSDFSPLLVRFFHAYIRRHDIDIVIVNVGKDLRTAGIAARLAGIPVVQRLGLHTDLKSTWSMRLPHRFIRPHFLAPCEFIPQFLPEHAPHMRDEEIVVIRTGKPCSPDEPGTVGDPLRFVMTSRLVPKKGHADILRALTALRDTDFQLDILGEGPARAELQALAAELGIAERVVFHGFTSDVGAHLARADVFLLPSRSEALSNALLEAMSAGLVPVARDVGGAREVWPDGLEDFLLPDVDGPELFARPLRTILDAEAASVLDWKRSAWRTCRERFEAGTQYGRLEAWLSSLLPTKAD